MFPQISIDLPETLFVEIYQVNHWQQIVIIKVILKCLKEIINKAHTVYTLLIKYEYMAMDWFELVYNFHFNMYVLFSCHNCSESNCVNNKSVDFKTQEILVIKFMLGKSHVHDFNIYALLACILVAIAARFINLNKTFDIRWSWCELV